MPVQGLCGGRAQGGTLSITRTSLAGFSILRTVQPSCGQCPPVSFPCCTGSKVVPSARLGITPSPVAHAGLAVVVSSLATVGNAWVALGVSHSSLAPSCSTDCFPSAALS